MEKRGRGERINYPEEFGHRAQYRCHQQNLASLLIHLCKFHSLATQAASSLWILQPHKAATVAIPAEVWDPLCLAP